MNKTSYHCSSRADSITPTSTYLSAHLNAQYLLFQPPPRQEIPHLCLDPTHRVAGCLRVLWTGHHRFLCTNHPRWMIQVLTRIQHPFVSESSPEADPHLLNDVGQQIHLHPNPCGVSGLLLVATRSFALMEGAAEDTPLFSL
jgi:hypothetical protein